VSSGARSAEVVACMGLYGIEEELQQALTSTEGVRQYGDAHGGRRGSSIPRRVSSCQLRSGVV
jgi:hypothetical protein